MGVAYSVGVDHLYTFFVQWSPDLYTSSGRKQSFLVVNRQELAMIDSLLDQTGPNNWEIITVRKSAHSRSLAGGLPARVQGTVWELVYSTAEHGTSLRTLYRKTAPIDRPVLLLIQDIHNQVFGAFSSDPFRVSNSCYGTGETFLFTFDPEFKTFCWSGENSYFVRGFLDSLQMGGGGPFGLWLDADLCRGSTFSCNTFRNQPLSPQQDFTIRAVEVW
uniref:Nuclear receptor coactivator 7a n=1 Tax=Astyanax mexicanus TaxID=7994 RepID=A0A3B1J1X4_ASTMX